MADPKQKSSLTLAQIDEALKRILDGSVASVNGINNSLLDNSFFLNPVNQKGKMEYAEVGYTIDRWKDCYAGGVEITESGIKLGRMKWFTQVFEHGEQFIGKTVTGSMLLADGRFFCGSGLFTGKQLRLFNFDSNYFDIMPNADGVSNGLIGARLVNYAETDSFSVVAINLELGSQQTLAHQDKSGTWVLNKIPDYSAQLLKCQRYYQLFSSADACPSDLADYRPSMRVNPAVGTITIGGKTYYFADANL